MENTKPYNIDKYDMPEILVDPSENDHKLYGYSHCLIFHKQH